MVEDLSPRLLAWAQIRLRGASAKIDAEDLVQEIWCRVCAKYSAGEGPPELQPGWVFQIAKFVLLEAIRKARYVGRVQTPEGRTTVFRAIDRVPAEVSSVAQRANRRETLHRFLDAVGAMDPVDQKIYLLCGLEDLPHGDVAIQLGMERGTVTKRWQRLRAKLRDLAPSTDLVGREPKDPDATS